MRKTLTTILIFFSLNVGAFAQTFDYPFKIGSYYEYTYSALNYRFYAKVTHDTIINGKLFAVLRFFDEPGMGDYDTYYRIDSVTNNIYDGITGTCVDSTGFTLIGGFKLPLGYVWNKCDTTEPYVRKYIIDTATYGNILNSGIPLKTFTRIDTITGITLDGTILHVYSEKFGFYAYSQSFSGPFGPYSIILKGAIIDSISYGEILLGVSQISTELPSTYKLEQNFPNPFNPSTTIRFSIVQSEEVKLIVYDQLGNEIKTLVDEKMAPGIYEYNFANNNLSSGVYFYKLIAGNFHQTKRMVLIK